MKKNIHSYKVIKIVEMTSLVVLEVLFLTILLSNHVMRSSIYSDRTIFTLCIMMWISMVMNFLFILYDFVKLRELKIQNHQLENLIYLDEKTGIPNRSGVDILFETFKNPEDIKDMGCVVSEISNIRAINEKYGKVYGDKIIFDFSKMFEDVSKLYGFAGRNGGNEFIALLKNCSEARMQEFLNALNKRITDYNTLTEKEVGIALGFKYVINRNSEYNTLSEMLAAAYKLLRE